MRKIRKISFFGILGVLMAVLFLASISFMQAHVQAKGKPDKPPGKPDKPDEEEATWAVQLPAIGADTMLYGDVGPYVNNGTDVIVKMERLTSILAKGRRAYTYYFCFKLVNPIDRYAGFQGVTFDGECFVDVTKPFCMFPGACVSEAPKCMECFLNTFDQPYTDPGGEDDYEYFYLKLWVSEYSLNHYTLEEMPLNEPFKFESGNDRIKFQVWNQADFYDPETEYHNIECYKINSDDGDYFNMNIWIVRSGENRWRIYVGINPADSGTKIGEELWVQEIYTIRTKGRKTETVVPLEAVGNFSFYIDFIKKPTTQ